MASSAELPALYPITLAGPFDETWWNCFQAGLERGYSLLQLRLKGYDDAEGHRVLERAAALCKRVGCRLLLNGPAEWQDHPGLAGRHLTSNELSGAKAAAAGSGRLLAASCHTYEELKRAEAIGADWVCLSPVFRTRSHPEAEPLGLETFADWAGRCQIPVYALGGVGPADLGRICAAGGQGVAGISAFWR